MAANGYLDLLAELGIVIPEQEWNEAHNITPEEPRQPHEPVDIDSVSGLPVFTTAQLEWCEPEQYGYDKYQVIEDELTAHPFALDYDQELYYAANYNNAIHRYSRQYRLRWVLGHLVGQLGKAPKDVEQRLRAELCREGSDVLWTREAYEWVRGRLRKWKLSQLYLSVPHIVSRLGGARWRVSLKQYTQVVEEATRLHKIFDSMKRQGKLQRQRFPPLLFVLLYLLDRHGVMPPYRIPWARTLIRRRELRHFLLFLQECLQEHGGLFSETTTGPSGSDRADTKAPPPPMPPTCRLPPTPPPEAQ